MKVKLNLIVGKAISGEWGKEDVSGNGIPVLRTTNFTNKGVIDYKDVVTRIIDKKKIDEKFLCNGDIIIEKSGGSDKQPVGRVVYFEGEDHKYLFNNFTGLLRVKDRSLWFPKYVFYFLFSNYKKGLTRRFENKTTGIHNLQTDRYIRDIEIESISLTKQKQIVSILDTVSGIIEKRKKQLEDLDELVKARFVEMFGDPVENPMGWEKRKLSEMCDVRDGTHDSPKYYESGYPLVTSKNLTLGKLDFSSCNYISKEDYDKINIRSKVDIGDILMPMIGTIGNPLIIKETVNFAIKNVALIKFNKTNNIINIFVNELLKSDYFYKLVINNIRGGTQKFIALKDIRNLKIILPPIELQNQFADFVKQMEKVKEKMQKSLDETQMLFDKLMQKYF